MLSARDRLWRTSKRDWLEPVGAGPKACHLRVCKRRASHTDWPNAAQTRRETRKWQRRSRRAEVFVSLPIVHRPAILASENPAQYRDHDADKDAGHQREIKSEIALLHGNVSGQAPYPAEPGRISPKQQPDQC
jgi:hypothetical protein